MYPDTLPIEQVLCYYYTTREFLISALANGLSLESEWKQVPSGLQDSFQYSNGSPQFYSLDGFHFQTDFQLEVFVV